MLPLTVTMLTVIATLCFSLVMTNANLIVEFTRCDKVVVGPGQYLVLRLEPAL